MSVFLAATSTLALAPVGTRTLLLLALIVVASLVLCWIVLSLVLRETVASSRRILRRDVPTEPRVGPEITQIGEENAPDRRAADSGAAALPVDTRRAADGLQSVHEPRQSAAEPYPGADTLR